MNKRLGWLWVGGLAGWLVGAGWAEPLPPGEYQYDIPCQDGLWDMSGSSQYCEDSLGEEICLDLTITQDPSGKFIGTGYGSAYIQGIDIEFDVDVSGSVKSSGDLRVLALKLDLDGTASYYGDVYDFNGSGTFQGELDCATGAAYGVVKAKACVVGYGCESGAGEGYVEPPSGMDGGWTLTINVLDADQITATIRLSNAELLELVGKAKYNSKTDATTLTAAGDKLSATSKGAKIKSAISGGDFGLDTLSGKALGQKLQ